MVFPFFPNNLYRYILNMSQFSAQKLLDSLQDTKLFISKYKQFKQAYAEHQQHIIHPSFCLLKDKLESQTGHPITKIHVLRAIKEGVDTGSYGVLQIVEAQILPILQRVALYKSDNTDHDRGKSFFLHELKQPSMKSEYQKIGNSYFRCVLECIEVWATIKPHFVSGFQEIESVESGYSIVYQNLKREGVVFPQKRSYYKPDDVGKFRDKYLEGLKKLSLRPEDYSDYYAARISKALDNQQTFKESETQAIINMMLIPDYLIQQNTLDIIYRNLSSEATPPIPKILSLKLVCQLFHSGSINVLDNIQYHILPVLMKTIKGINGGGKGMSRGGKLFPNNVKLGQKLYHQILKTIVLLGESCPKDPLTGEETHLKKAIVDLNNNGYQLPMVVQVSDFKIDYQENAQNIKRINSLFKRKKSSAPPAIMSSYQTINSSKRFIIPQFDPRTDIHQIMSILKSIYSQFKILDPKNEEKDRKWIIQVVGYLNSYNKNIDPILQENLELSDFDSITNEAYVLLQKNINICEELDNPIAYIKKLEAIRNIIGGMQTPNPDGNTSSNKIVAHSLSNTPERHLQNNKSKQMKKLIEKSMSVDNPQSQPKISDLKLQKESQKVEQVSYHNKSISSNDRKLYEKEKKQQIQVIAQYEKQHFNSRRINSQERSEEISYKSKPKSSNILSVENSFEQRSIIHNILDNDLHSVTSEPNALGNKNNESLLSNPGKPKNKIGVRRIQDSRSFDEELSSLIRSKKDIPRDHLERNRNEFAFIKEEITQSKNITGSKNVIKKQELKLSALPLADPYGNGMGDSFGNPAFITNNRNSSEQVMNFKKKDKLNNSMKREIQNEINNQFKTTFETGSENVKQPVLKTVPLKEHLKAANFIKANSHQRPNIRSYQQQSQIIEPGIEPMNNSFYEPQAQIKQQILKVANTQIPQFNDCFEAQKYLIPSKSFGGEAKKYWLQQDAKMLTTFNKSINEGSVKSQIHTGISVPQIIAEHNKHFQLQMQGVRDQHKKEILFLQNKIRKLERHNKEQEKALTEQKSEIQSLKGGPRSQINLGATYKSHQQQFLESENLVLKNRLQNQTKSNYQSRNLSPAKTISDQFIFSRQKFNKIPKGEIFPSQPYQQFISMISDINLKKQMLKNKDLLVKNENLEVGFIVSKEKNCLRVALFFQSQSKQLTDISMKLSSKGLNLQTYPEVFPRQMKSGKQERYVIAVFITNDLRLPYEIPSIQMNYRIQHRNQTFSAQFPLPITFNRLLEYTEIDAFKFKQIYKLNVQYITRGQQVTYNKKILRDVPSIKQILPKLQIMNPYKQAEYLQGNAVIKLGVKALYEPLNAQFLIKINLKPGNTLYIQTVPLSKPSVNRIPQQLLICTLNQLVKKQRLW